jgi:hypothetical protein
MKTRSLFKFSTLALAGLLSFAAFAAPVTFNESAAGTGDLPGATDVIASGAENGLSIRGDLKDGRGGFAPNLVDMFQFSVGVAGTYRFNTFGSAIADTQLFLFDSAGMGLYWNNDASLAPVDTLSAFNATLGLGDYYVAVSFFGLDADDGAGSIFDTLGNGGSALAGSGSIAGWTDFSGLGVPGTVWDVTGYTISIELPEPGALALSLMALGLMAGVHGRRARKA